MISGYLWTTTEEEKKQCFSIREKVFVEEQGFSIENEFDAIDQEAHHLLFLDDETPIATARLFLENGTWHIGRICVLKEYRGQNIGKFLVEECVQKAKELGESNQVWLDAQCRVRGFYEALGFEARGEEHLDEWCPHISMVKFLD
ncbi:MAG: GNAT family N-acetyltransferase [Massiliimalia sp.]